VPGSNRVNVIEFVQLITPVIISREEGNLYNSTADVIWILLSSNKKNLTLRKRINYFHIIYSVRVYDKLSVSVFTVFKLLFERSESTLESFAAHSKFPAEIINALRIIYVLSLLYKDTLTALNDETSIISFRSTPIGVSHI